MLRGASLELHRQPEIWVSHVTERDTGTLTLGCVVQCTCRPTWAFVCSSAEGSQLLARHWGIWGWAQSPCLAPEILSLLKQIHSISEEKIKG